MSDLVLKNRRCTNKQPHPEHQWRGLNTRGAGYYCAGISTAQVIDLMEALRKALARPRNTGRGEPGAPA